MFDKHKQEAQGPHCSFKKTVKMNIYDYIISLTRRWKLKIEWVLFFIWPILNSIHPRMFVPSLIEIGPVILEKEILKYILLFRSYLPLEKGLALH